MRKFILHSFALSLLFIFSFPTFAEEKNYSCYRLTKEPALDGRLKNDPAWKNIPEIFGFVKLGCNSPPLKQTSFKIGYTPEALYFGVECEEPEIEKIEAKYKDGDVRIWTEDSVEIFIFPKGADNYYQFMINTIGSRWNGIGLGGPTIPLGNWRAETYKGKDCWSVEVKIPFKIFGKVPEDKEVWSGNISRNILTLGEGGDRDRFTTWAYLKGSFHEPDNFGRIVFNDKSLSIKSVKKIEKKINLPFENRLKKEIKERMELLSNWKAEFLEASKNPSFQKQAIAILKTYKEIEKQFFSLDTLFSVKELNLLLKRSRNLLKEAEGLRSRILLDNFFDSY